LPNCFDSPGREQFLPGLAIFVLTRCLADSLTR
jgi:hypothetical protein